MDMLTNSGLKIAGLLIFFLLGYIWFGEKGYQDLRQLCARKDQLIAENEALMKANSELYKKMQRAKEDPKYIEDIARRELGMIGKDEIVFKIIKKAEQ